MHVAWQPAKERTLAKNMAQKLAEGPIHGLPSSSQSPLRQPTNYLHIAQGLPFKGLYFGFQKMTAGYERSHVRKADMQGSSTPTPWFVERSRVGWPTNAGVMRCNHPVKIHQPSMHPQNGLTIL
jgi:hypothetical protein